MKRAAVVVNPVKVDDASAVRRDVCAVMADAGWADPLWFETTTEDTGEAQARQAVAEGVDVVFACGGDGTVMACVTALAGSGTPLGVLPVGTGNLLARNLGLPLDMADALRVGLSGDDRSIDVGTFVVGGDADQGRRFVVMAGIGFDAAMMADAPEALKAKFGWPAYVVSGVRHLRDRGVQVVVRVDDLPPLHRAVQAVVVGNVGRLQAGVALFPAAAPDDGLLDVAVIAPRGIGEWLRVIGRLALRRRREDARFERLRGRRIEIRARTPMPVQLDGDPLDTAAHVVVEVEPGGLVVRVAPGEERR
jgi:YegS/Rv2252/BmrU family lipid kinase